MAKPGRMNFSIVGDGFLFTEDGLSLEELAVKLHEDGYLSYEDMDDEGGVPALRRQLYDEINQGRHHYPLDEPRPTDDESILAMSAKDKLNREVNSFAEHHKVNDPEYMDMIITPEDMDTFGIEVNGPNLVEAELLAKAITINVVGLEDFLKAYPENKQQLIKMVTWILGGRK
jgi:hypothetical protein